MTTNHVDVLLVGAGIMSATLGVLLKQLNPALSMAVIEQRPDIMQESTSGWNNAGTGHAAYCELNYTPQDMDGTIHYEKAYSINASFEVSLQFWASLVKQGALPDPQSFIQPVPHISFVWGETNVAYLRERFANLSVHPQFAEMEYSEDPAVIAEWIPLVMAGRDPQQKVAATRVKHGTDVNFGALGRQMLGHLQAFNDFELHVNHAVNHIEKLANGQWKVKARNEQDHSSLEFRAKFIFLGGGGGALPLLQMANVPEGKGYGGFPVSGQWLVCKKPDIVAQHFAKVYGRASIGAPPMSVPHLDTRVIDTEHALLFGPFAGFSTKFLKHGSIFDLIESLRPSNLLPMLRVGLTSFDLIRYLISEVLQTHASRIAALREYYPNVRSEDWVLQTAGQRVQIIKKDPKTGLGKLEFGTEVVTTADGSLAVLLGASPGASVAVSAMLQIIERCFSEGMRSPAWQAKLKALIPSYGQSLKDNPELLAEVQRYTLGTLQLAD